MQSALPDTDLASVARAVAAVGSHEFVHLDYEVFKACQRMAVVDPGPSKRRALTTWKPVGAVFFTLIKVPNDTIVYCHANDTVYYTHAWMKLGHEVPSHTAFLAQWCEDALTDGTSPRLLVFDLYCPDVKDPRQRGAMLRDLQTHLPPPCVIQWAGEHDALLVFLPTLPHKVEALLCLTDNPLRVERVELPKA